MSKQNQGTITLSKSDFTFAELFKDFNCPEVSLFAFDNVQISVDGNGLKDPNTVSFSGELEMTGILSAFKDLLKSEDKLLLTGKIATTGELTDKIEAQSVVLTSAISFHIPLFNGVTLTGLSFKLAIAKDGTAWTMTPTLSGSLTIDNITDADEGKLSVSISKSGDNLLLNANGQNVKGAFGFQHLILDSRSAEGQIGASNELRIAADFIAGSTTFGFAGIITPEATGMLATAVKFTMNDIGNIFHEISPTQLALPDFEVTFNKTSIAIASADCTINGTVVQKGLTLISDITAHDHTISTSAQISANGVVFEGTLGDITVGPVKVEKAGLDFQIYKKALQKPTLFSIFGEATIENVDVNCGIYFEKQTSNWTTVLYANLQAPTLSFSTVFPSAKGTFVDSLKFSKAGFIFASADCTTQDPQLSFTVKQGLNLMAVVEEIPGLSDLTGSTHIGLIMAAHFGTTTDISIAIPDTKLNLSPSVETDPFKIVINLLPQPSLALVFGLSVTVPKQEKPLHFDMVLDLGLLEAKGSVTMKNYWYDPFSVKGLKIGPAVALQLGIIYEQFVATGIPSEFGIAGGLGIGKTEVDMAVNISENPSEEILSGSLEQLDMKDLVEFAASIVQLKVADEDIPDFLDLKELQIYVAPTGGSIGTITYQPGFSFSCDLVVASKEFAFYTRISDNGIEGFGHIDNLELGPLKITGEEGKDATVALELTEEEQSLKIDGAISFLGAKEGLYVDISNKSTVFRFEQKFFNIYSFEVLGQSSGSIKNPASLDFQLSADMDNNITAFLKDQVSDKIEDILNAADEDIDAASKKVNQARNAYNAAYQPAQKALTDAQINADNYLKQLRSDLKAARNNYTADVTKAEQVLKKAKDAYDEAFQNAQNDVTNAKTDYIKALSDAQNAVDTAEKEYDFALTSAQKAVSAAKKKYNNGIHGAQNSVNSASRKVNSLLGEINNVKRKIENLKWYEKPAAAVFSAELAGLYTAYGTAKGVLATANAFLEGIKYGVDYIAFESAKQTLQAVKIGGKYVAFKSAEETLQMVRNGGKYVAFESAKKTLEVVRLGTEYTAWQTAEKSLSSAKVLGQAAIETAKKALRNIGSSAISIALQVAKQTLWAVQQGSEAIAFRTAQAVLIAAKEGSKAVLGLADYITQHAGDLIDIKSFHISGSLKEIEKGKPFDADLKVSILGKNYTWNVELNIKDVPDFIENLFNKTFEAAKNIAGVQVR